MLSRRNISSPQFSSSPLKKITYRRQPITICKSEFDVGLHLFSKGIITFTMIYCGLNYLHYRQK